MPLSEISPNIRRHGNRSQTSTPPKKALSPVKNTTSLATGALQNMLRTTTETGEIGMFSVRPSRLPHSGSRVQQTRRRSGSFDSSLPSGLPHATSRQSHGKTPRSNGSRQIPSFSSLPRQDTIRSNLTSYHNNPRSRVRTGRMYHHGVPGIATSSSGQHGLYSHRSLVTLRSQRDFSSVGSSSPMGYPGRPLRPGHRATSPAFSEFSKYGHHTRPRYHKATGVATAASSPGSTYPRSMGGPRHGPTMNGSVTSFVRLPSPAFQPYFHGPNRSPFPTRTTTPVSTSFYQSNGFVHHTPESVQKLQRSPTGSTIPQYYDYTESFAEEDCFSFDPDVSTSSLPFNMDQTILENAPAPIFRRAQTPFGAVPGSAFHPSEMPTKHNRTSSEHSKKSNSRANAEVPGRRSSLAFSEKPAQTKIAKTEVSSTRVH